MRLWGNMNIQYDTITQVWCYQSTRCVYNFIITELFFTDSISNPTTRFIQLYQKFAFSNTNINTNEHAEQSQQTSCTYIFDWLFLVFGLWDLFLHHHIIDLFIPSKMFTFLFQALLLFLEQFSFFHMVAQGLRQTYILFVHRLGCLI